MRGDVPSVSVIVPVFNGAEFLSEAIRSILAQNYTPIELILVDDGSTDDTATVAAGFGDAVAYIRQDNQGPAAARNQGLRLATGELISFLDADDIWPRGRLRHHVSILMQHPDVQLVIGPTRFVLFDNDVPGSATPILPAPLVQHHVGSATYRRALFDRVGWFDPGLRIEEDKKWFRQMLTLAVPLFITPEVALEFRIRKGSLSHGKFDYQKGFLAAVRAHLDQRKAESARYARDAKGAGTRRRTDP